MHRFIINPGDIKDSVAPLSAEETLHALRVLRLKDGEAVQALDGLGGVFNGRMIIDGETASIFITEKADPTEAPVRVTLYMGLPKGEKLEFIAQKLTELGAVKIVPVRMERSVAKIAPNEAEKKLSRPRRIAQEAQKQSGRGIMPEITDPVDMKQLPELFKRHDAVYMLWEEARGYRLSGAHAEHPALNDIAYIVGPEGGISVKEAEYMHSLGAEYVTMGPRILRAETAAVAGCVEIMTLWGDL